LSKSLLGSKAGAGGLAGLLRIGFSVLGGDCFGGDVDIIYICKTNLLRHKIITNYNEQKHEFHSKHEKIK
jgi:hypothetical protein